MKLDWIPQLFKDLIGRVVPGATVLLAAYIVRAGHFGVVRSLVTNFRDESSLALVLTGLVISYILGYCLTQVWGMTLGKLAPGKRPPPETIWKKLLPVDLEELEKRLQKERLLEHNQLQAALDQKYISSSEQLPQVFVMHDHIRLTVPQEANRLSKMQSEIRMCRSLIIGIGILCVVNLFYEPTLARVMIEVVMLAVVSSSWRREKNLHKYHANGVCVIWLALASTGQLFKLPK